MISTTGLHIATVRQYSQTTGVATVVIPGLYGDVPVEARPILPSPAEVVNLPALDPGDTVIAFYDGGNPMTILRWYPTGGTGGGGGGTDEVWIGTDEPTDAASELWFDPDEPAGTFGGFAYVHNQGTPASVWTINHPLSFQPNISVVDSAGDQVEGNVRYTDADTITVTFSAAFSGIAYLS